MNKKEYRYTISGAFNIDFKRAALRIHDIRHVPVEFILLFVEITFSLSLIKNDCSDEEGMRWSRISGCLTVLLNSFGN